ncbi:MAG: pyridoxamine 5'-phosphate oxidase family protein [Chitinophagaceae bacterium]|nr:pyridoxamine 5'-phosphate oxidase family protein [Chitinophagaceae bacterium]
MFGKLNSEDIESLVHAQLVGRIGCTNKGKSYVVPISYAYDGQYIYAHTSEGMKIDMMRKNPDVCFQVDDTKDLSNWQSAILWGEFEELPKDPQRTEALKVLSARKIPFISSETMHLTSQWPFQDDDDLSKIPGIVFRIRITEKTGRFEKKTEKGFYAS